MVTRPCAFGQRQIAFQQNALGDRRHRWQREPGRKLAARGARASAQGRVLWMMNHKGVGGLGIGHAGPHHPCISDGVVGIRQCNRTCVQQELLLGHLGAPQAEGERAHRMHMYGRNLPSTRKSKLHECGIIQRRIGVGLCNDGRHTACGSGLTRRAIALAMSCARLAHEHAHVDDAGGEHLACAVHHDTFAGVRRRAAHHVRDHRTRNAQCPWTVIACHRIDEAGIEKMNRRQDVTSAPVSSHSGSGGSGQGSPSATWSASTCDSPSTSKTAIGGVSSSYEKSSIS